MGTCLEARLVWSHYANLESGGSRLGLGMTTTWENKTTYSDKAQAATENGLLRHENKFRRGTTISLTRLPTTFTSSLICAVPIYLPKEGLVCIIHHTPGY